MSVKPDFFSKAVPLSQKSDEKETISTNNSLDELFNKLYQLPDKIQFCHHNTTSYAKHMALDRTYNSLVEMKDEIVEKLIGYTGQRIKTLTLGTISSYTEELPKQLAQEIINFGNQLEEYGEENGYCDIENLAQSYAGIGAQLNYLLTLS